MPATTSTETLACTQRLILGDARDLSLIPDGSVHLVLTSPPYWNLKRYNEPCTFCRTLNAFLYYDDNLTIFVLLFFLRFCRNNPFFSALSNST